MASKTQPPEAEILSRKYETNFLDKVIIRIDFAAPITMSLDLRKKLITQHRKAFPILEEGLEVAAEFEVQEDKSLAPKAAPKSSKVWQLKGGDKQLAVSENFAWIQYSKYESFDVLRDEFLKLVELIHKTEKGIHSKRIGLRYVDKLSFPNEKNATDWSNYLSSDMLCIFDVAEDRSMISRAFSVLEMNYGNGMNMRLQYGMMNSAYPARIKEKVYIIDHDVYSTDLLEKPQIRDVLQKLRVKAKVSFEKLIKDGLRDKMGRKK